MGQIQWGKPGGSALQEAKAEASQILASWGSLVGPYLKIQKKKKSSLATEPILSIHEALGSQNCSKRKELRGSMDTDTGTWKTLQTGEGEGTDEQTVQTGEGMDEQ